VKRWPGAVSLSDVDASDDETPADNFSTRRHLDRFPKKHPLLGPVWRAAGHPATAAEFHLRHLPVRRPVLHQYAGSTANQNNFFGETAGGGGWDNSITCGPGTRSKYACFSSYYDSASAAFSSFGSKYGGILTEGFAEGMTASQAFQALANLGWDPKNANYSQNVADTMKTADTLLSCLQNNGYLH